jgi:glycosyltransferase involved in cell wall biosynthesis
MIWLLVDSGSVGGIERHVATLAEALRMQGHDARIVLLARHGDNPWLRQLSDCGLAYTVLDGSLRGLVRQLRNDRPGLVHTHGYKANLLGRIAARSLGISVVSTFHAGERAPFPVNVYQLADEYTSFLGARLCVSEAIQASLPFGATLAKNFLIAPKVAPSADLPHRIGFVGRLSHEKAPDLFCELARRHSGQLDATWHVWGDGPMRADLERQFGASVTFHGLVTDLAPVWGSLGLLMMPSRAEGLPMAALEALAAGIPVAASAIGGLPGVVRPGKTGYLFEAGDLDAASGAIRLWSALDTAAQAVMRRQCWELVRNEFSEVRHLPAILQSYRAAGLAPSPLIQAA